MNFDIQNVPSQKGRVAVVTGANAGLGYETALALAKKEAKVVLACRNMTKAEAAKNKILKQVPQADLDIIQIDLSKLKSVRDFAKNYLAKYSRLDLLINNAGVMMPPYSETEDGFELQMGANYFGHFLLTGLLLDVLEQTPESRIVTLSSLAHKQGQIQFDDLHFKKKYSKSGAYGQSKLACLMFTYELQRRLTANNSKVLSVASHPGISDTELSRHFPKLLVAILLPIFSLFMLQSAEAGAEPTLYAALGDDIVGGDYTGPNGRGEYKGRAVKVKPASHAESLEVAKKLWEVSEDLVGLTYL